MTDFGTLFVYSMGAFILALTYCWYQDKRLGVIR